ncbi:hypothetical protein CEXT_554391 [Caerostris extrusa]|uniref:Uncharacterized protein n=1 Tax=Caerostris extrusa TaxID=172846 RepID=A0AAV4NM25_CAEEX|nr:hypothetical protein CEXT_554391 [Caerostris extrusa]
MLNSTKKDQFPEVNENRVSEHTRRDARQVTKLVYFRKEFNMWTEEQRQIEIYESTKFVEHEERRIAYFKVNTIGPSVYETK